MTIAIIVIVLLSITIGLVIFLKSKKSDKKEDKEEVVERVEEPKVIKKIEPKVEVVKEVKKLPEANYPKYDHSRMITTLGLSEDDAVEFMADLIAQIDTTLPQIESAINAQNFEAMESLTHSIKGSATNLGTGGVASLLIDFNTYLKTQKDLDIINRYFEHLNYYNNELKEQYA